MACLTLRPAFHWIKGTDGDSEGVSDLVQAKKIVRADPEVKYSSLIDKKKLLLPS